MSDRFELALEVDDANRNESTMTKPMMPKIRGRNHSCVKLSICALLGSAGSKSTLTCWPTLKGDGLLPVDEMMVCGLPSGALKTKCG